MAVLAPGTMLGGCRIDAVVGRGGMGVVYRARQVDLDRDVAVKVVAPELTEDPKSRARFIREARAAGAVEHPNVIPVHGAGVADGQCYLVMRYVAGDDLAAIVDDSGPLEAAVAAKITAQLGQALDAIHDAGYVHRDVKPRNVMIDADGHAYLSDFGLAKQALATAGPTTSEQWVGTLDYVAPEQIRGEKVGPAADVYALGAVLYFMLTGRVPFERESQHAKLWAHLHDAPPQPSTARAALPRGFDALVARALAKNPADRQASAGELGRAARVVAAGGAPDTVSATRPLPRTRVRKPRRRLAGGAALALLVGLAGLAAVLLSGGADRRGRTTAAARQGVRVGPTIHLGGFRPRGVAVAAGSVWVISTTEERVTQIDAASGRRRTRAPFVGRGAADIASDREIVWVAINRGAVLGIDAREGRVTRSVDTPGPAIRVAAGRGGLWVVVRTRRGGPASLLRYRRDGGSSVPLDEPLEFETGIRSITLGGGSLWVATQRENEVVRVAPGGAPRHAGWLSGAATGLAYGRGALWASVGHDDEVARVDPETKLSPTTRVHPRPAQLVLAAGRVFVACSGDSTIVMLDPATRKPVGDPLPAKSNPTGMAEGAGHVWVTGLGESTLTRLDF